jgi:hypothetical protein
VATTARSNGRPRPSTLDPDRRRTPDPHPGFWELPAGQTLVICGRCSCPIPDTDRAKRKHLEHHGQVDSHDPR